MNLTFLNATFLFAASVAALPIIIHLISRRRVETLDWSSLRFLKELERKRIRRVRLRQIFLLIVRSLILLLAALALSRPTLTGPAAAGARAHARTSVAIVLDASASMSRSGEGGDLAARAVGLGQDIAALLEDGDQAFLVTATRPADALLQEGTFSKDALAEELAAVAPGWSGTDLPGAVALAAELLAGARNLNREMYLIGDMQRSGWARKADVRPAADAGRVYVLPLSGPEGNLAVTSVAVSRKHGGTRGLFSVSAAVASFARRPVDVPVKLFLDGVQVGQAGVAIPPRANASATFAATVDERAWHSGWVELPGDALEADNRRYFVVPPATTTEVLVVRPDSGGERDDAYYLSLSLDPTGAGRFRPITVAASSLARQDEGRFPVVVLADAGRVEPEAEAWLKRHVESGGGLLVVLGGRTDIRYWNGGTLPGSSGAVLREPVERAAGMRIAPSGQGHPLLEGLVFGDRLIDDVLVRRSFSMDLADAESILELPGVGPLLAVRGGGGRGEVALLLSGVDPAWGDLPRSGFLVPLVHRLAERLAGPSTSPMPATVGEDLVVPLAAAPAGRVDVELPDGSTAAAAVLEGGRRGVVLERAPMPGVYRFTAGGADVALGAVNLEPAESDLAPAAPDEVSQSLAPLECRFVDPDGDLETSILEARRGRELWRVFVYLALGLVGVEMLLARTRAA